MLAGEQRHLLVPAEVHAGGRDRDRRAAGPAIEVRVVLGRLAGDLQLAVGDLAGHEEALGAVGEQVRDRRRRDRVRLVPDAAEVAHDDLADVELDLDRLQPERGGVRGEALAVARAALRRRLLLVDPVEVDDRAQALPVRERRVPAVDPAAERGRPAAAGARHSRRRDDGGLDRHGARRPPDADRGPAPLRLGEVREHVGGDGVIDPQRRAEPHRVVDEEQREGVARALWRPARGVADAQLARDVAVAHRRRQLHAATRVDDARRADDERRRRRRRCRTGRERPREHLVDRLRERLPCAPRGGERAPRAVEQDVLDDAERGQRQEGGRVDRVRERRRVAERARELQVEHRAQALRAAAAVVGAVAVLPADAQVAQRERRRRDGARLLAAVERDGAMDDARRGRAAARVEVGVRAPGDLLVAREGARDVQRAELAAQRVRHGGEGGAVARAPGDVRVEVRAQGGRDDDQPTARLRGDRLEHRERRVAQRAGLVGLVEAEHVDERVDAVAVREQVVERVDAAREEEADAGRRRRRIRGRRGVLDADRPQPWIEPREHLDEARQARGERRVRRLGELQRQALGHRRDEVAGGRERSAVEQGHARAAHCEGEQGPAAG